MPSANPKIQSALEELRRRGINVDGGDVAQNLPAAPGQPVSQTPLPATPSPVTPDDLTVQYAAGPKPMQATGAQPEPDYSSPRDAERQLRLKRIKGELAIQDAVNELKRRGINTQLRTAPGVEEVVERGVQESVESSRKQGDPEAFKGAWRQLFPGKPLPRKPDGQIDYEGGQDDIDVEVDRKKKLEAAKVGARNIKEVKTTRLDPATGKEQEVLVRIDSVTGEKLGETILSENPKALTESQANAKMFSSRMESNNQIVNALENKKGFDVTGVGTTVQKFLPNRFQSDDLQSYNAAKQNWIAAVLRKESGAAISAKEYRDAEAQYFPRDGDSAAVVKQKQQLRQQVQTQMHESIGPHQPSAGATAAPAAGAAPAAEQPVPVKSAAEAPPTAKFIISPKGRTYRNPKYTGP